MMAIFEKYTAMGAQPQMKSRILTHVLELLGVTEFNAIHNVEKDSQSIWITLEDGSVKSLMIVDCESEIPDHLTKY